LGFVGQDGDGVVANLGDAAKNGHAAFAYVVQDAEHAVIKDGHTGLMPRQDTHVAGDAAHDNHIAPLVEFLLFGGDDP
jgi:hypothetical protein